MPPHHQQLYFSTSPPDTRVFSGTTAPASMKQSEATKEPLSTLAPGPTMTPSLIVQDSRRALAPEQRAVEGKASW